MDLYEERHKKRASAPEFTFHTQRRYNNNNNNNRQNKHQAQHDNPTNIVSSRDNIGSSRDNIGSSRDNIGNTRDNTGSSRGNTDYNTNGRSFNGTSSHRRYSNDSCTVVDSHSTRSSQKRQPHHGILL
ncbi:unnamed protein product [Closterium sp. NIES-54]